MPTPSEQKALTFVAIVILLGGAVRVLRAGSSTAPTEVEQQALARQAAAADSAWARSKGSKASKRVKATRSARDTLPHVVGRDGPEAPTLPRTQRPLRHHPR